MTPTVTVLLLMGGRSSEHEVSLVSARGVMAALDPEAFSVVPVTIATDGTWTCDGAPVTLTLADGRPVLAGLDDARRTPVDVVFPVLHGPFGEDGTVQGLCEMVGVPYVGAGVAASAVAMDKALFKTVARQNGLPVADAVVVVPASWATDRPAVHEAVAAMGYPVFVKPARLGSSVGISRVAESGGLDAAVDAALAHDDKVLIEQGIVGREVEVGVLDNGRMVVSPPGEIRYAGEWYDYDTKYQEGRAQLQIPADLPEGVTRRLQEVALTAYDAVGCQGMGRVDCFVTTAGEVVVSEINTIPGFTPTSAYPSLMAAAGVPYPQLVSRLVASALERSAHERTLRR
jgi:D-alanine-D-alanine ligase